MIQNFETHIQDVSHHYDELDELYRELWGTHLHHGLWENESDSKSIAVENLSRKVLSYLVPLKGKQLVDIGCGYGGTSRLAIDLGAEEVTGITISEKQFEYASKYSLRYPITYHLRDWLENNFSANSFDGGFSIECFSHILNKARYFSEVNRTLKPGAPFVMTAWLSDEDPEIWQRTWLLDPICREGRLPSLYTQSELEDELTASGLELVKHVDLTDKVWKTWAISSSEVLNLLRSKKGIQYFLNEKNSERKFALSVLRILLAYKTKCFKYGLFVARKPVTH